MNLLQIALTDRCNLRCDECPMKEYLRKDKSKYETANIRLIPFLYRHVNPKEWFLELTGGEPALYEGLDELLQWLTNHEYRGLIKTNGQLEIGRYGHFPRIAAWHGKAMPRFYDKILLIYGIQDYEAKAEFCLENKIPFDTIGLNKDYSLGRMTHRLDKISFINAVGQVLDCPAGTPEPVMGQYGDLSTVDFSELKTRDCCPHCKAALDFWRFIEPSWREM